MITSGMVTVYVTDMERAEKFYTDTLGLDLACFEDPDGNRFHLSEERGEHG